MRWIGRLLLLTLIFAAAFGWGFVSHWKRTFPFDLLKGITQKPAVAQDTATLEIDMNDLLMLDALGYTDGTYDPESGRRGVILHRKGEASPGINLYHSLGSAGASLIDLSGNEIHAWRAGGRPWNHVEPLRDGGVVVSVKNAFLARLSKDSTELWEIQDLFHHDFFIDEDEGEIWAIVRTDRIEPGIHRKVKTLSEELMVLSLEGEIRARHSIIDMLRGTPHAHLIPSLTHRNFGDAEVIDPFHLNHVEVFDGSQAKQSPLFARGNILLSLRNINAIMIVDGMTMKALWVWGPAVLLKQHHPTLLDNGNILVFNNGSSRSEVIELDPETFEVDWVYGPGEQFFTVNMGSSQRLPNGNTLITESRKGYVFEVDPAGEIVWHFANPDVDAEGIRASMWRMTRYPPGELPF
jgi:hypothetical protein